MNNKKIIALLLAFAMMFSTITTAFADTTATIGADAEALKALGVLQGENTSGVTPEYLAKETTRMQAAIMLLRLKGLEEEAMAYTGTDNFADANTMTWKEGKAIMAYLKANPQVGFEGADGGKFEPFTTITAQQYYKVMLVALGYKQTSANVAGDFEWKDVIAFAASKGLVKVADAAKFTNNDVAVATIEALKINVKDTTTTLATSMVDAGMINKDAAIAAGLYEDVATTDAELKAVKAIANNKVEVEFTAAVSKAFAEKADNYKVVTKGSTTALEVKGAVQESATVVVIETAAQTAGTAYTMTVGEVSMNFAGLAKISAVPEVESVEAVDTNTVEVEFDRVMDNASATNVANYTATNGATVKSAVLSADRKTVTLTTEGVEDNKVYKLTVKDVTSSDMVAVKATTKQFRGNSDTTAPKLDDIKLAQNNARFTIFFDDDHGVDKASAETIANYSIVDSDGTALEIENIVAKDVDEDDFYERVEVTTAPQDKGEKYTLTINDLVDGSVSANKTTKALTDSFRANAADTDAPDIDDANFINDNKLEIVFEDDNRLDVAAATDASNYELDNDVNVIKAEILDTEDLDSTEGHTVILTTSVVDEDERYTLTVGDIADEFGNIIDESDRVEKSIKGVVEDIIPPYVASVKAISKTEVEITFQNDTNNSGKLNKATAEDPTNYVINNSMGAALEAELEDNKYVVTLTTPEQVAGKTYEITMNNIEDINGNALSNVKAKFVGYSSNDTERPVVESIDVVAKNVVIVTFDEKVNATTATMKLTDKDSNVINFAQAVRTMDDETSVMFISNPNEMTEDVDYTVTEIKNVTDKQGNRYVVPADDDDKDTIEGIDEINEGPAVESIEQIDVETFRVIFSEPVTIRAGKDAEDIDSIGTNDNDDILKDVSADGNFSVTFDPDEDKDDEGYSTIELTVNGSDMDADELYAFDFTDFITDYAGAPAIDEEDEFDTDLVTALTHNGYLAGFDPNSVTIAETYIEDEDGPEVEDVVAINENQIEVTFNEKLSNAGDYRLVDEDDKRITISGTELDDEVVTLTTSTKMNADTVYTLTLTRGAKDIAGNSSETSEEFDFVGSSVKVLDYIAGVQIINARQIKVTASKEIDDFNNDIVVKHGTVEIGRVEKGDLTANKTYQTVNLNKALLEDETYTVSIGGMSYSFKGLLENGNLEVNNDIVSFSGYDVKDYVVKVVYDDNNDGVIADTETYFVLPTDTNEDGVIDSFDVTSVYDADGNLITLDADTNYALEVYRTDNAISLVEADETDVDTIINTIAEYLANVNTAGGMESTPIYAFGFTK
ncbi:MAG TPA: Ig-like domain-containing protein [Clostridia bacterium]|nr:Ig-like domain-containing protein [Clostridia bacterium]